MRIELNGAVMTDRQTMHTHLQEQLHLPAYYGRNLDALFDLLTECGERTEICVMHWSELESNLGHYAAALMDTLYDAAAENPNLKITVH